MKWKKLAPDEKGNWITNDTDEESYPVWSPDGTKIAFGRAPKDAEKQLFIVNADGSGLIQLTNTPGIEAEDPSWSPDGTMLAFQRGPLGGESDIYVMLLDGSGLTRLTTSGHDWAPSWR